MKSALRVERTGNLRDAIPAMIAAALLGNFHSYDVIPLFASWFVYRLIHDLTARRFDRAAWLRLIVVGLAAAPTTLWVFYISRIDPVFYKRAFVSATLSPKLWWDLLGFGLPLVYAGVAFLFPPPTPSLIPMREGVGGGKMYFLLTFLLVGIAVAYFPVAFQRKLLMGAHVPLCVLAGVGLSALTAGLSGDFPKIAAFFGVLLTVPSNVLFLVRDTDRLSINASSTANQPYLKATEIAALDFLRDHTAPDSVVLVSPDASSQNRPPGVALMPYLSVYVPAYTGRTDYIGHWGETVAYKDKMAKMHQFFRADTAENAGAMDAFRQTLLNNGHITYVLYDNRLAAGPIVGANGSPILKPDGTPAYTGVDWLKNTPPYLQIAFQNADVTVYVVRKIALTPTLSLP